MSRGLVSAAATQATAQRESRVAPWTQTPIWLKGSVLLTALATFTIALRPLPNLLWHPFIEDAYYSFAVSRNLALGNGLTIDGETWTNGFQPFTTIVYSLPFLGPQPVEETLRIILILQWLAMIATGVLIGLIVRTYLEGSQGSRYAFAAGFLAYIGSFYAINTALNGLETGTLLLGYAVLWRFLQTRGLDAARNAVWFGLIAGLVGLIRIDSLIITAVLLLGALFVYGFRSAVTAGLVTALVVSPWILYGFLLTGNPIPSSGRAQTAIEFSSFRLDRILEAVSATGFPWLPISTLIPGASTWIRLTLIGVLVFVFLRLRRQLTNTDIKRRTELFALLLSVSVVMLATYYGITSFASWFYGRYLSPLLLVAAFLLATVLVLAGRMITAVGTIALTTLALAASAAHWLTGFYQENTMLTEQVALVQRTVPPGEPVAASQTGTLGFFQPGTINLDGKVNAEVLEFDGTTDDYLRLRSVEWMCDWPRQLEDFLGEDLAGWSIVSTEGEYACAYRSLAGVQ